MINTSTNIVDITTELNTIYFGNECFVGRNISADLKTSIEYFSTIDIDCTVISRNGLEFRPSKRVIGPNRVKGIFIRHSYEGTTEQLIKIKESLQHVTEDSPYELRVLRATFDTLSVESLGRATLLCEYHLTESELYKRGGSVYIDHLDVIITTKVGRDKPVHPNTTEGRKSKLRDDALENYDDTSMLWSIKIVDNEGAHGNFLYMNIGGMVSRIPVVQSNVHKSGVYVTTTGRGDKDYTVTTSKDMDTYTIDECMWDSDSTDIQGVVLFSSYNAAKTHGNIGSIVDLEIKNKEKELRELTNQHQKEKTELDLELVKIKREAAQFEDNLKREQQRRADETNRFKEERERWKAKNEEDYRERERERKEYLEVLKMIPIILTSTVALIVGYNKLFGNDED